MKLSCLFVCSAFCLTATAGCDRRQPLDQHSQLGTSGNALQTVFVILMENANWSQIKNSASAPFLNQTVLPMASHAEAYSNPPGIHPSLPNYLWLEAGSNLGVTADGQPNQYHQATSSHFVNELENAGYTWKAYVEGIDGVHCPLTDDDLFVTRHVPFLFFDDVTNRNNSNAGRCISHIRPYSELANDLATGNVADYNFITPNLCNDMHGSNPFGFHFDCVPFFTDLVHVGDTWLSQQVPMIMDSYAYQSGGALFITWDEGEGASSDGPIGMVVLSPFAKGGGYSNSMHYTHSSTLLTFSEVFGVSPLRDAQSANDLSDLFFTFP